MNWAFNIGFNSGFMGGYYNRYYDFYGSNPYSFDFNIFYRPFFNYRSNILYRPLFNYRPSFDYTDYWRIQRRPNFYDLDYSQNRDKEIHSDTDYSYSSYRRIFNPTKKPSNTDVKDTKVKKDTSIHTIDNKIDKSKRIFLGRQIKTERGMFGMRMHPIDKVKKMHYGLDLPYENNEDVYSFTDGTVTHSSWGNGYGNWIEIEDANGVRHRYAHANKLLVKVGQKVKAGELIMLAGKTGKATGPHVHYETLVNGKQVDPFTVWA